MSLIVAAGVIVLILIVWVGRTRSARKNWLSEINLPGTWELNDNAQNTLEFIGSQSSGNYLATFNNQLESGRWLISGSDLVMIAKDDVEKRYELRLFELGKIGINGPDRDRHIYNKQATNVIPMQPTA